MLAEKILKYELSKIPETIIRHLSLEKVTNTIEKQIENNEKYIYDETSAKQIMESLSHQNKNIEDYKCHILEFEENNLALCRIKLYRIGSEHMHFVEILQKSFDIIERALMNEIMKKTLEKYQIFDPKGICFLETSDMDFDGAGRMVCQSQFLTGHINTIRKLNKPERYDEVELEQTDKFDFYEEYVSEYELLKSENAIYHNDIIAETINSLKKAISDGYLFKIKINGKLAGILAAEKLNINFYCGYCIKEEILFKNFRRQNFGPALQRKMIDSIKASDDEFIYGIISPLNTASLRTARKCGRIAVGGDYYIKFNNKIYE